MSKPACGWRLSATTPPSLHRRTTIRAQRRAHGESGLGSRGQDFPQGRRSTRFARTRLRLINPKEEEGKTRVTSQPTLPTVEAREQAAKYAIEGGNQTLARLEQHLVTRQ